VRARAWAAAGLLAGFCLLAAAARAELVVLKDGDRVRGKIVVRGTKRLRLQTAYGLLIIPLDRIDKIVHDDGREELLTPPAPVPTPEPTPPPAAELALVVTGRTFWFAWDPKAPPADPSLRLEVQVDGKTVAGYVDHLVDEGEISGALVNAFSFVPDAMTAVAGPDSRVLLPESTPGRISLEIELPADRAGDRKLRFAYQVNDDAPGDPAWRTVAETTLDVTLGVAAPLVVRLEQDMGRLEWKRKQMRNLETVRLMARPE
jgi:hypothetical protein